jgi:methyl-accepting chemotaxis protein
MAGSNGKGFAAVAIDMRRLAERAREQTTIINQIVNNVLEDITTVRNLIQTTKQESAQSTLLTRQMGSTLETIFTVVEYQANGIELANHDATQQLNSSMSVVHLMQAVSEAGMQNTASTREVTRQVERLAQLAGQLLTSVEVFKVREASPSSAPGNNTPLYKVQQNNNSQPALLQSLRNVPNRFKRPVDASSAQFPSGRN